MRMSRRAIGGAACAAMLLWPAAPASAAVKTKTYMQLNLAGNSMHGGGLAPAKEVVAQVRAEQPYVVTLNEVCATQFDYLRKQLAGGGYRAWHGRTGVNCKDGSAFGNVVLIRIASSVAGNWQLPNPVEKEHRRLLCVKATNYAMVACATHISWGSGDQAAQTRAVADRLKTFRDQGYRVILGGDFNLTPANTSMDPLYDGCYPNGTGSFFEAAGVRCSARSGAATVGATRKIDYLFFSEEYQGLSARVASTKVSDHKILWATATY